LKNYKPKICAICGKEFMPTGRHQKYCKECKIVAKRIARRLRQRKWCQKDSVKEKFRKYYLKNSEKIKETSKKWQKENRERWLELTKEAHDKRRRSLGFEPVNKPFENSNGHHMSDGITVIYIPNWLHRLVWHNHNTGQGMDKMDSFAVRWWLINIIETKNWYKST
jgi:hypothetical protein